VRGWGNGGDVRDGARASRGGGHCAELALRQTRDAKG